MNFMITGRLFSKPLLGALLLAVFAGQFAGSCGFFAAESSGLATETASPAFSENLNERMKVLSENLALSGFTKLDWTESEFLEQGESFCSELKPGTPGRLLLVGIGEKGMSLNLSVQNIETGETTKDTAPDLRTALEVLSLHGAALQLEVQAESGTGRFLIAAFKGSLEIEAVALAGLFDADIQRRDTWDVVEERATARGYSSVGKAFGQVLSRGERVSKKIETRAGHCYLFVAHGENGIDRLSLRLHDSDGLIATDLSERYEGWISHCALKNSSVKLSLKIDAGSGGVRMGVYSAPRESILEEVGPPLVHSDVTIPLDEYAVRYEEKTSAVGYRPGSELFRGKLIAGERVSRLFAFDSTTTCALFSALPGEGLRDLDIEISAKNGDRIVADRSPGALSSIPLCGEPGDEYTVDLVAISGVGEAQIIVNPLPQTDFPSSMDVVPYPLKEAAAFFIAHSMSLHSSPKLKEGEFPKSWKSDISLDSSHCYALAASVKLSRIAGLQLVDKTRDDSGENSWIGPSGLGMLALCPRDKTEYTLKVSTEVPTESPPSVIIYEVSSESLWSLDTK